MSTNDFIVESSDGLELCARTWSPPSFVPLKARILFIHGFCEFQDSYNDWFPMISQAGYEVTGFDQRGFGHTALTPRDYGRSNESLIMADLETMVNYISKNKDVPLVLWGFSLGGAMCLNYMVVGLKRDVIDVYIATSPFLRVSTFINKGRNAIKLKLLPLIVRLVPQFRSKVRLGSEDQTNDPEKWPLCEANTLRHLKTTAIYMRDTIRRGRRLLKPSYIWHISDKPLLICQGTGDKVCDVEAVKKFYDIVKLSDKALDLYEDLPHELMQCLDEDRLDHWRRVHLWLDKRIDYIS